MKRKLFLLTAIMLSFSLFLTACGQTKNDVVLAVGEEKGKAAGLALINQAFDTSETEASVEYQTRVATAYRDGTTGKEVLLEPDRVYVVKTAPKKGETDSYYAEVDAVTGIAYYATRAVSGIILTKDQQKQADALKPLDALDLNSFRDTQNDALAIVETYVKKRLEKDVPILRTFPDMIETDSADFPKLFLEYFVIMQGGKVYNLTLCWPTMDLVRVYIRN